MNTVEYYKKVNKVAGQLREKHESDTIYITSIEDASVARTGGVVTTASPDVAAKMLADNTHRESTAEEIEQYEIAQDQTARQIREKDLRRRQQVVVTVAPEEHPVRPSRERKPKQAAEPAEKEE